MSSESIHNSLYVNPFFVQPGYQQLTEKECAVKGALPSKEEWNTENKIARIARQLFCILFFPIALCQLTHRLIGKVFIHASSPLILRMMYKFTASPLSLRKPLHLDDEWEYKRKTIWVNGTKISIMLMGTSATLRNRRWILPSAGNGEFFENMLTTRHALKKFAAATKANVIFFNYPGVGESGGLPSKLGMVNTMKALLNCLEDEKRGIGAKEIIAYGHSFVGAGVQAEAFDKRPLKEGIKYLLIKDRAASSIADMGSAATFRPLGSVVNLLGWNFSTAQCSKRLEIPEIILQTASVRKYERLLDSSNIIFDGVIQNQASLAQVLLDDDSCSKENKVFLGVYEDHDTPLNQGGMLGQIVNEILSPAR